jgi:hypothetical protein
MKQYSACIILNLAARAAYHFRIFTIFSLVSLSLWCATLGITMGWFSRYAQATRQIRQEAKADTVKKQIATELDNALIRAGVPEVCGTLALLRTERDNYQRTLDRLTGLAQRFDCAARIKYLCENIRESIAQIERYEHELTDLGWSLAAARIEWRETSVE